MQQPDLLWTQPEWLERAATWIHDELKRCNIAVTGSIDQIHVRPWSTVLRVPTCEGSVYFKAVTPALANEPAVVQALARWHPGVVPKLLAADSERRWMLQRDGGTRLRELFHSADDLQHWHRLLPQYAELQIELSDHLEELIAVGVIDRRLERLPGQLEGLLDDAPALRIGAENGLSLDEYRRLVALSPHVNAMCAQLAELRIPQSINHDDFHDGNVFVRDGHYIFFDWGDSCATHPFLTLVVTLRSIAYRLNWDESGPELARLRDAYLEPWTRFETRANLLAAYSIAHRLGMVCRALTWHTALSTVPSSDQAEYADAVPGWLQDLLAAESPGTS